MNSKSQRGTSARDAMACLAVDSRFRLVKALADGDRCVGELAVSVGLSQSCTTRHLQALERAGLVEGRREGRRVRFTLCAGVPTAAEILSLALGEPVRPTASPDQPRGRSTAARRRAKTLPGKAIEDGSRTSSSDGPDGRAESDRPAMPPRVQELEDYLL